MKKTILVIDNDSNAASLISRTLEAEGYLVFTASSGEMALTMGKKVTPLLVFLNLATPGTNGLDICKSIHAIDSIKDVPLIVLTPGDTQFDPRYKTLYGIVGFLKKPFMPQEVISMTDSAIQGEPAPEADFSFEPPKEEPVNEEEMFSFGGPEEEQAEEPFKDDGTQAFSGFELKEEYSSPADHDTTTITQKSKPKPEPKEEEPFSTMSFDEHDFHEPPQSAPEPFQTVAAHEQTMKQSPDEIKNIFEEDEGFPLPGSSSQEPSEPAVSEDEPKESDTQTYVPKKRLKSSGQKRSLPALIGIGSVVLIGAGIAAFFLLRSTEQRKPAECVADKTASCKPLKKPQTSPDTQAVGNAPQATTTAAAVQPAPKPAGPVLYIQFGSFPDDKSASPMLSRLKSKGIDALLLQGTKKGKAIYRVVSSQTFESKKLAQESSKKLKASKKLTTTIHVAEDADKTVEITVAQKPAPSPSPAPAPAPIAQASAPAPAQQAKPEATKPVAKPEAKKPEPKPAPAVAEGKTAGKFFVQFGAFSSDENAAKAVSELKGKGINAGIHKITMNGKTLLRVLSSPVADRKSAQTLASSLKAKGIDCVVFENK